MLGGSPKHSKKAWAPMTPTQFRSERERLGLTQQAAAELADLSLETIRDFEEGRPVNASLIDAIRVTMESVGASFET